MIHDPFTDAFGRQLSSTTSSAGLSLTTTNTYDSLGRLLSTTDPAGLVTSNKYDTANRTHTVYNPDGGTQNNVRFLDGQSKSTAGSATHLSTTTYGFLADGTRWTRQARNGGLFLLNQIRYATSFTDFLGRSAKTERQRAFAPRTGSDHLHVTLTTCLIDRNRLLASNNVNPRTPTLPACLKNDSHF